MSLLRKTRTEVAGAWRSLRYDMGRKPEQPVSGGPDMTSTGMSTFGGTALHEPAREPRAVRAPRRAVAVSAFGVLTVVGATGAYLGVVNGLGSLMSESEASAGTVPQRPAATSQAQLGQGPAVRRAAAASGAPLAGRTALGPDGVVATDQPSVDGGADGTGSVTGTTPAGITPPGITPPGTTPPGMTPTRAPRPTSTENPDDPSEMPPVPTPTAPSSSPSPTDAAPSPSATTVEPSASVSDEPSESAEPSDSTEARHRRHRR